MSEVFDFGDGRGPVPAHRHSNGGGWVADTAHVDPTAYVGPDARVYGNGRVSDYGQVSSNGLVYGNGRVSGNGQVSRPSDCATIGPVGSRHATLTLHRTEDGHRYNTGCFSGTFLDLKAACRAAHGPGSPHDRAYGAAAVALWRIVMGYTPIPTEEP